MPATPTRLKHDCLREQLRKSVERSIGIVKALNPCIGYANTTEVAA
jgi:aspartate ammonia-lyase